MSGVHFHLIVNHLPVVGAVFAAFALIWALWCKAKEAATFGLICLVVLGMFAGMAYFSGEPADEAVKDIATVSHSFIEEHEDTAFVAFLAAGASGVVGLLGLFFRGNRERSWSLPAGLAVAILTFGLMAWTANLGGMVRHTEIRPVGSTVGDQSDHRQRDNHD